MIRCVGLMVFFLLTEDCAIAHPPAAGIRLNYPAGGAKQARHAIKTARPHPSPGRRDKNDGEEGSTGDPGPPRMLHRPGACFMPSVAIAVAAAIHFILERRRRRQEAAAAAELGLHDLGMLKLIRDAAGELYDRHRPQPQSKVVDLCRIISSRKGGGC